LEAENEEGFDPIQEIEALELDTQRRRRDACDIEVYSSLARKKKATRTTKIGNKNWKWSPLQQYPLVHGRTTSHSLQFVLDTSTN
jgi:hypothetical protein